MSTLQRDSTSYPSLRRRLVFFTVYVAGLYFAAGIITRDWVPSGGGEWLWWLSAIAMFLFKALAAPFFVRPRDSLANAITAAVMLFTLDLESVEALSGPIEVFRWVAFGIAAITVCIAVAAIVLQNAAMGQDSVEARAGRSAYHIANSLGGAAVMFTPPALISIIGFHQDQLVEVLWLSAVWMVVVSIRPLELMSKLYEQLRGPISGRSMPAVVGAVTRVDDPDIVRVTLRTTTTWTSDTLHIARLAGDRYVGVVPLFFQVQNDQITGTGLCCDHPLVPGIGSGEVWTSPQDQSTDSLLAQLAGTEAADLVGFVVEDSSIAAIRFEVATNTSLREGSVVFVRDGDKHVYFQVLDAITREELFTQNPRGTHVVIAAQLGTFCQGKGFQKYGWTPRMNAPVFIAKATAGFADDRSAPRNLNEFVLGRIESTGMEVVADLSDMADYHTAILGVTGTGKTELVLDLIRAHVKAGRKVFCVDCTGEYEIRLNKLSPEKLGFPPDSIEALDKLVNDAEHGEFNAAKEKRALHEWVTANRSTVADLVAKFLESDDTLVGLFSLDDIANTRASLRATEIYLSAIFAWAKQNRKARDVVIVLEEAHTVIPEMNVFGFDKADTQATVGRMAQIALQGRKYGVGLLLVSQRTALVSKTLLSQCNTTICFAMYDKTGLDYLASVFSADHVRVIPNLRFLQGIAFGKAVRSERPVIFEVPEDPVKRRASEALNKRIGDDLGGEKSIAGDRQGPTE